MSSSFFQANERGRSHGEPHPRGGSWLRDVVFGLNDGLVSILALVAGVAGANPGQRVVLLAGVAGVVSGAASMAIGAYISAKSEREFYRSELAREKHEMEHLREVEIQEIRDIYREKGFEGDELELVVSRITSDSDVWLRVMMHEELGLAGDIPNPLKIGAVMGGAFIAGGVAPVLPFMFAGGIRAEVASFLASSVALFAAGAGRSRFTARNPWRGGLEMLAAGLFAVMVAYGLGSLFGAAGF